MSESYLMRRAAKFVVMNTFKLRHKVESSGQASSLFGRIDNFKRLFGEEYKKSLGQKK